MKREIFALLIALLFVQLVACERSKTDEISPEQDNARLSNEAAGTYRIETKKTTGIKKQEPMLFTLVGGTSPHIIWRVVPQQIVENRGTKSVVYFQKEGKYRVSATDSLGTESTFIDVEVTDEAYVRPNYNQEIQADDELIVTPRTFADSINYLDLQLSTRKSYQCKENILRLAPDMSGNPYEFVVVSVDVPEECTQGEMPAKRTFVVSGNVADGASGEISIKFKGTVYKGTFKRSGRNYTFTWPYSQGVTFTTKSI